MKNGKQKKGVFKFLVASFLSLVLVDGPLYAETNLPLSEDALQPTVKEGAQDPLESFNRVMFSFNDKLDIYFLKPIATFYHKVVPRPLNKGIHNFFNNLNELPTIANDILQFNFYQMANDMWRLGINTTLGIGGLFDVATQINLKHYTNGFGLTLAKWGWTNSTYVVWPFFGPSTIRDGIEIPVDYFAFSIYPYIKPDSTRYELYGLGVLDRRANLLQYQSVLEEAAVDKYVFMRNAYLQRRSYQIEDTHHRGYHGQNADCVAESDSSSGVEAVAESNAQTTEPAKPSEQNKLTDTKLTTEPEKATLSQAVNGQNKTMASAQEIASKTNANSNPGDKDKQKAMAEKSSMNGLIPQTDGH